MSHDPTGYLAFQQAARAHEEMAKGTGSVVEAEIARLLHREAMKRRLQALRPPQKCVECGATIAGDQRQCARCGRARQGVKIGSQEVLNLLRFLGNYDFASVERNIQRARTWDKDQEARLKLSRSICGSGRGDLEKARKIRADRANGEMLVSLAEKYGFSRSHILKILAGKKWPEPPSGAA